MTLSCATDWILVVGQWPVLDLWLKPPRSYGPVIDTQIRTHTVKAAHKLVRRFSTVKGCWVLRLFENTTVTLSCVTDWNLMVGQWPVLDLWLKPPRSVAGI